MPHASLPNPAVDARRRLAGCMFPHHRGNEPAQMPQVACERNMTLALIRIASSPVQAVGTRLNVIANHSDVYADGRRTKVDRGMCRFVFRRVVATGASGNTSSIVAASPAATHSVFPSRAHARARQSELRGRAGQHADRDIGTHGPRRAGGAVRSTRLLSVCNTTTAEHAAENPARVVDDVEIAAPARSSRVRGQRPRSGTAPQPPRPRMRLRAVRARH